MLLMLYLQFFQLQRLESICYPYFLLQPKQEKQLDKHQNLIQVILEHMQSYAKHILNCLAQQIKKV